MKGDRRTLHRSITIMKLISVLLTLILALNTALLPAASDPPAPASPVAERIDNPAIDMQGFLQNAAEAAAHRESRLLTEQEFLRMSRRPGVIILDARSREKFDLLHIGGAINLSFPDITIESLERVLPDKSATILIYCNNNFRNAEQAFPSKMPATSLNLSTYLTLFNYGYRNVYELGLLLDPAESILPFESSEERESGLRE